MGTKEIDNYFKDGFVVINIFTARDVNLILSEIEKYYFRIGKKHKVSISNLKSYHRLPISQDTHNLMMHPDTRQIKLKEKFIKKIQQNKIAKSITKIIYSQKKTGIFCEHKNFHRRNYVKIQIQRPLDKTTGVHAELSGYTKYAPITVWCPLIGFDSRYTLRIAPGSHLNTHQTSPSKKVQGQYRIPFINNNYLKKFKFIRPKLKKGQAIMFHANLLHGGSTCFGKYTRVSINPRLFINEVFFNKKNKSISPSNFFLKHFQYRRWILERHRPHS